MAGDKVEMGVWGKAEEIGGGGGNWGWVGEGRGR